MNLKIAFCSSEVVPFAKTGGMADVCGSLPLALEKLGQDVSIIMPGYSSIDRQEFGFTPVLDDVSKTVLGKGVSVYLIEHPEYFGRAGLYGDENGDYPDNLKRFDHYCRRSLEIMKELNLGIDIVHCHDWQTALIPVYLKERLSEYPSYKNLRTILSLHNLAYQGHFSKADFDTLSFGDALYVKEFEFYGKANLLKAGIVAADAVATVSPQYAREIQTREFGAGLEGVLAARGESVIGILNGLDYNTWDPSRDKYIASRYSAKDLRPKRDNKKVLQKTFKLPVEENVPVFVFVSRLSHQKGVDLIQEVMPRVAKLDAQFIFLGIGEQKYHAMLQDWARAFPKKVGIKLAFDEGLAHQCYAGGDLFLMPSIYEPCGLSQMISMRYGTVPLVNRVGGLADTVIPHDQEGNGFVFTEYNAEDLARAIETSVEVFADQERFAAIRAKGLAANFSWEDSARQYVGLYHQCAKI